nr:probable myosin light chain kinase DDB_G0282429 [Procambarus clarkii]
MGPKHHAAPPINPHHHITNNQVRTSGWSCILQDWSDISVTVAPAAELCDRCNINVSIRTLSVATGVGEPVPLSLNQRRAPDSLEIEALAALRGLVGVQKLLGVCPETLTLITEYSGETWTGVLERGQSVQECLKVLRQVCQITETIHARGWVHVDIKADNICVHHTSEGIQATIIDFGLAMRIGEQADFPEGTQCAYIAPEVLENRPCTPAADVYSIATMFHFSAQYCNFSARCPLRLYMTRALEPRQHQRPGMTLLTTVCSKALDMRRRYRVIYV